MKTLKGIGGFYYVKTAKGIYECKAIGCQFFNYTKFIFCIIKKDYI